MRILPEPYDSLREEVGVSDAGVVAILLGVWLVPGLLAAAETLAFWRMADVSYPPWRAFALQLPGWLSFAVLTPAILWTGERILRGTNRRALAGGLHLLAALTLGSVYALAAATAWRAFSPMDTAPFGRLVLSWYLSSLPVQVLCYFGVFGAGRALFWFVEHRRNEIASARLAAELSDARLAALRMQLHPHFLFNSLNAVAVLVRDRDVDGAGKVLSLLAGLLRETLRSRQEQVIPLEEEIDFIRRYLAVESVRFSDRLRVAIDVPAELARQPVPALILQPLVENAIRHGISQRSASGSIEIRARADGGRLVLTVEDDGPGPDTGGRAAADADAQADGGSVGLANTRTRLSLLYGDAAACELARRDGGGGGDGGARASITLPLGAPDA